MKYRGEIDGLRAIAVIPVVLFHAGMRHFEGGYVGVDVFFVVSGYLITTIILEDLAKDRFSIIQFYERRARRILPALFAILSVCVLLGWILVVPRDFAGMGKNILGVSLFFSNFQFWRGFGYFGADAESSPLLHTWSLAIEEQYYILFPPMLWLLWRFGKKLLPVALATGLLLSLGVAEWGVRHTPAAAFFLLPTRAWELLFGALAAWWLRRRPEPLAGSRMIVGRNVLDAVGLALILWPVVSYSEATPFPGLNALLPTVGTVLIVLFSGGHTVTGRLLATRPLVGVGLVSYSLYLWHQPLLAFLGHASLGEPAAVRIFAVIPLSGGLSYLTWRYVETPFRDRSRLTRRHVFAFSGVGTLAFAGTGLFISAQDGLPGRMGFSPTLGSSFEFAEGALDCFDRPGVHEREDWYCLIGDPEAPPSFVAVGDSHILPFFGPLGEVAAVAGRSGIFVGASGCPPLLEIHALRSDQGIRNCHLLNERVLDLSRSLAIRDVYLIARWTYYTEGGRAGTNLMPLGLSPEDPRTKESSRRAFITGLGATVTAYSELGLRLHFVQNVPEQLWDPIKLYFLRDFVGRNKEDPTYLRQYSVGYRDDQTFQEYTKNLILQYDHVVDVIDLSDTWCADGVCLIGTDSASFYHDDDHLSDWGATLASGRLAESLLVVH